MVNIEGHCDERFGRVREAFENNFAERGDVGASFAVTLEGEYVVDLWGGYRDAAVPAPGRNKRSSTSTPPPRP